jgi:hypothetical protein
MKYYDIYMTIEDDCKEGYSVFVAAKNEDEAIKKLKDEELYEDEEDLDNIKSVTEISYEDFQLASSHPLVF